MKKHSIGAVHFEEIDRFTRSDDGIDKPTWETMPAIFRTSFYMSIYIYPFIYRLTSQSDKDYNVLLS